MTIAYNDAPVTAREPRAGILAAIVGIFSLVPRSIAAANAYETLSNLSDAQLARRGLARPDVANVALQVLLDDK